MKNGRIKYTTGTINTFLEIVSENVSNGVRGTAKQEMPDSDVDLV